MTDRTFIAIDLKSFYATVECADRRLAPMATNLVVADESRTEKTICLAVSSSLKACGFCGRVCQDGLAPHMEEYIRVLLEDNVLQAYGIRESVKLEVIR